MSKTLTRYRDLLLEFDAVINKPGWDTPVMALTEKMAFLHDKMGEGEKQEAFRMQMDLYQRRIA